MQSETSALNLSLIIVQPAATAPAAAAYAIVAADDDASLAAVSHVRREQLISTDRF